ncbi:MAG: hypothetical protein JXA21_24245 [Anaerolineae bacterium]|nr:hypothetical protein [Anaerolineae bacterium]
MTEKTTTEKTSPEKSSEKNKGSQIFGKRSAEFFGELLNQPVLVAVSNGKVFKGNLVGVDVYDIIVCQESGLELLIPKGNIVYIHRVTG